MYRLQKISHFGSRIQTARKFNNDIRGVVFDMGGVLISSPFRSFRRWEKLHQLPPGSFSKLILNSFYKEYEQLEVGNMNVQEFSSLLTDHFKRNGKHVNVLDIFKYMHQNASISKRSLMLQTVRELRNLQYKVAVLSNNWFVDDACTRSLMPLNTADFDAVIESCLVRERKPYAPIFDMVCKKLSLNANELVFLDDLGVNLKAANDLGFTTVKVTDSEKAIMDLDSILGTSLAKTMLSIPGTKPVPERLAIDKQALIEYLSINASAWGLKGDMSDVFVRQFAHGQSNPTYFVRAGDEEIVLRKRPPGTLLKSAHAIDREYRVIKALSDESVPVPELIGFCSDENIVGSDFYLMRYAKDGVVFKSLQLSNMTPAQRTGIYNSLIDSLCALHKVDISKTLLQDYGSHNKNYLSRQISRWAKQYRASETDPIPEMDALIEWLRKQMENIQKHVSLVHGDYRLDNMIFNSKSLQPIAIIDWELSTIGDPYTDLAYLCLIHHTPTDLKLLPGIKDVDVKSLGIPTDQEMITRYCSNMNLDKQEFEKYFDLYLSYTCWRGAAIFQGVYRRSLSGQASSASANIAKTQRSRYAELAFSFAKRYASANGLTLKRSFSTSSINRDTMPFSSSALRPHAQSLLKQVKEFIESEIKPVEQELDLYSTNSGTQWTVDSRLVSLKQKAIKKGLFNLFLPIESDPNLKYGAGLTNLEYAFICEEMGKHFFAPEVFNCQAPDTGNIEVLVKYGSEAQKSRWLPGLLSGELKSCFAMTEPLVASSDAVNIESTIDVDGDDLVLNGRKWFISNAMHPNCSLIIFMGKNDKAAAKHLQQSMVLVPMNTPGVKVVRPLSVFGYFDGPGGHAEVIFDNVRVKKDENLLVGLGKGFEIAQGRLGPGRVHHCMRLIGYSEQCLSLMIKRAKERHAFGSKLIEKDSVQNAIAEARMNIDQARLLVLRTAHKMDTVGNKIAAKDIAMIKAVVPRLAQNVLDSVIQVHGAAGMSDDFPIARFYTWSRVLRIADGPDEVHLRSIARMEIKEQSKL